MERTDYTAFAKLLHWLIALLIFVQFPLAWVMDDFAGLAKFKAYNLHKSVGITVLALMVLRVGWRVIYPAPSLPAKMPAYERHAARLGHLGLYVLIILMTLSGWAMISASNKPSVLFQTTGFPLIPWLSNLPAADKKGWEEFFEGAHGLIANLLLVFIAVHIAAALRHAILLKDGILSRMLPRFGGGASSMKVCLFSLMAAGALLGAIPGADAVEWGIDPKKSTIAFEARGGGSVTNGTFGRYKAEIIFDSDAPDQTSVRVRIDMRSARTDDKDVDLTLQAAEYFFPEKFPFADYVAKGAKFVSEGKYVLNGTLTMRGIAKPLSLPFTIDINGATARVKAETVINRMDYGVGPETAAGVPIDKDVRLTLDLTGLRLDN